MILYNDRFKKMANTVKIEVLEAGFSELDRNWRSRDASSPYSRLYYVISGKGYLRLRGKEDASVHELRPGYLYLIPNGLSYEYYCEDRLDKVYFHINVLLQNGLELFSDCENYYELAVEEELAGRMKQWLLSGRAEDCFHMNGEIYHAVGAFMEAAGVAAKAERQYSAMVREVFAISPNLKVAVTVREIAAILNVSESTLAKQFKKETGMSIGSYREQLLMNRARQLLAMGRLSVGEIAEALGFGDPFYFSKYFKQRQGCTPSKYKGHYR